MKVKLGPKARLVFFMGCGFVLWGLGSLVNDLRVYNWQQVEATIVHFENRCCMARGEPDTVYVQYQYELHGQQYVNDQVALRAREVRKNGEKEYTLTDYRQFKLGQKLPAYVNGEVVVLERRVSEQAIILLIFGVIAILCGRFLIRQ